MRKRLLVLLTVTLALAWLEPVATAAVKPGTVCKKVGQTSTSSGIKYTCVKSGKKLVWNKGVAIKAADPKPTPSPTPTPTPTVTSTPTPTNEKPFVQPLAPSSFEDLPSRIDGIIYGAWLQASQQIQKSSSQLGTVNILVGPNTNPTDANSIDSLSLISKLYSNSPQVKKLYVIKFSKDDVAWAQQQYDLLRPNNYRANAAASYCLQSTGCRGGMAGINSASDGVILLAQGGDYGYPLKESTMDGAVIAHEYAHTIQAINAVCRGGAGCYGELPQWLMEGSAQWSGSVSRLSGKYSDFIFFRTKDLANKYGDASTFTADWITTFLNPNPVFLPNQDNWAYWAKYPSDNVYSIGFMATEILVNIKGPGAIMKLYEDVGRGQSFVEAFKQGYGIAWSDACPIIASAIAVELSRQIKS